MEEKVILTDEEVERLTIIKSKIEEVFNTVLKAVEPHQQIYWKYRDLPDLPVKELDDKKEALFKHFFDVSQESLDFGISCYNEMDRINKALEASAKAKKAANLTKPVRRDGCWNCMEFDGKYCTREWNNGDSSYKVADRDERHPDDKCDDGWQLWPDADWEDYHDTDVT